MLSGIITKKEHYRMCLVLRDQSLYHYDSTVCTAVCPMTICWENISDQTTASAPSHQGYSSLDICSTQRSDLICLIQTTNTFLTALS